MDVLGNPSRESTCGFVTTTAYERLKAENEELKKRLAQYELFREVVGDPVLEFASLRRKIHHVERENAKLRELVQDYDKMLSSMNALCDCDFVPLNDAVLLGLRSRMYKLGIEVE